jgi:hypothetical protein
MTEPANKLVQFDDGDLEFDQYDGVWRIVPNHKSKAEVKHFSGWQQDQPTKIAFIARNSQTCLDFVRAITK